MRAIVLFASLASIVSLVCAESAALVACSTSPSLASGGADAASPQAVGAPCDLASPQPCLPSGDRCTGVVCDPVLRVCTQFDTDAGGECSADVAPCSSTADCDLGLTCGFPVAGGCSAKGTCINPPLPCENDAASCATEPPVCGCNGLADPFVIPGFAVAPVASAGVCVDGGAALDGATDAPSATDAADAEAD
jgi:hypothetical protein